MKIPSVRAKRAKGERIDKNKVDQFTLPPRDLGKVPSLRDRPINKPKELLPEKDVPKDKEKLKFEQELSTVSTRPTPPPPVPPSQVSHVPKNIEKIPTLSDLLL